MSIRVSPAELAASRITFRPSEVAAMVLELCRQCARGSLRGIPSAQVIRLTADGRVVAEGPVNTGPSDVVRAAHLLNELLPIDAHAVGRMPGGLRLVIARAEGTLDLPPYASLEEFAAGLARFAAPDLPAIVREVFQCWQRVNAPVSTTRPGMPVLTISDVRRARRATGLSLDEVSAICGVPADRLRELEWGYLLNWRADAEGRAALGRYARAASLDEQVVLDVAWPLFENLPRHIVTVEPVLPVVEVLVPARTLTLPPATITIENGPAGKRLKRWTWLASSALLVCAFVPLMLRHASPTPSSSFAGPSMSAASSLSVEPGASPDGVRPAVLPVAYSAAARGTDSALAGSATFVQSGRGSLLSILRVADRRAQNADVCPSPDGTRIAFDSDRDGTRGVFVADAAGREVRRVSGAGFAAAPSWSPDDRTIAFLKAEPQAPAVWNLWTADIQTGDLNRLTSYASGHPSGPSWFPDASRIAMGHQAELVIVDRTTGTSRRFDSPRAGRAVRALGVSPDGRRIIFQVDRDGAWLLDLAGGGMRRVLDDPTAEAFSWAKDGRKVAFYSPRAGGWGVWRMDR